MNNLKRILFVCLFLTLLGLGSPSFAQKVVHKKQIERYYTLYFRLNQSHIDLNYKGNGVTIQRMVDDINSTLEIQGALPEKLHIVAATSPEGSAAVNQKLALKRGQQAKKQLVSLFPQYKSENIEVVSIVDAWDGVIQMLEDDPTIKYRNQLLAILKNRKFDNSQKDSALKRMPEAYAQIRNNLMENRRTVSLVISVVISAPERQYHRVPKVAYRQFDVPVQPHVKADPIVYIKPASPKPLPQPVYEDTGLNFRLKTNTIGWTMGHFNVAAEVDLAEHWSVAVPFYYSGGFNYFKETVKFRGIVIQPEARYYLKDNEGFYMGAHLGLGWYNFAVDGEYRIQDYKGHRPAYGAGLGIGYSRTFKRNSNWGIEFALGAGVYDAKYDKFYNEENGYYAETGTRKTFFGIDNASVSFVYKLGNRHKHGKEGRR